MDNDQARLDAATGQLVRETLDRLRATARLYTGDQNTAAPQLARWLLDTCSADVLANTLANVLLDQVRDADTRAVVGPITVVADEAHETQNVSAALHKLIHLGRLPGLVDTIGPGSGMARYGQRANLADIAALREQITVPVLDDGVARCRFCRCTEDYACDGGCAWATDEQTRAAGLEPMDGDVCTACIAERSADDNSTFDYELGGVEVRLIGPEPAVRAVQAIMRDGGIPEIGERGPFHAADRDDNAVRVYWATDLNTARASKNRTRGGRPDRPGKRSSRRGQQGRGQ